MRPDRTCTPIRFHVLSAKQALLRGPLSRRKEALVIEQISKIANDLGIGNITVRPDEHGVSVSLPRLPSAPAANRLAAANCHIPHNASRFVIQARLEHLKRCFE
jgi:hypothetical protein